ncbi:MAG: hypothetical protein ACYSU4_12850 [Planctomycetota bacterium]
MDVLLSGEYSRRRGYLTSVIAGLNGLVFVGTLSIWSLLLHWDTPLIEIGCKKMFAIQIALAGSLSSILIGLWRFYVRFLDKSIIKLYPVIYMCERSLIPEETCTTITPPNDVKPLSKKNIDDGSIEWEPVKNEKFERRGHCFLDIFAIILILCFGFLSIGVAWYFKLITIFILGIPHSIGLLLIGNVIGIVFVLLGQKNWRKQEIKWPIPNQS